MPKDEFGYDYLRRPDGGVFIITAWACAVASIVCAVIAAVDSSFDLMVVGSGLASLWAIFFITGYVSRAIYFVAGDAEKPRARSGKSARWRPEEGYNRVEI
jgi:hypothetical protein